MLECHNNIQLVFIQLRNAPSNNLVSITNLLDMTLVSLATDTIALISCNINRVKILVDTDEVKKDKFYYWPEDKK